MVVSRSRYSHAHSHALWFMGKLCPVTTASQGTGAQSFRVTDNCHFSLFYGLIESRWQVLLVFLE